MTKSDPDVQHDEVLSKIDLRDNVAIGAASNGAKICNSEPPDFPKS